jgi:alkyl hydroperoxide reductase subunit AhpC
MSEEKLGCGRPTGGPVGAPPEEPAEAVVHDKFQQLGVQLLSVSTDSIFVHKVWQEEELSKMADKGVPFPMLSGAAGHVWEEWKPGS